VKTPKKGKPIILGKVKTYLTGNAFTLSWYADGERKREMRSTLEDAMSRAKEINKDLDAGRGHVKSFTTTETALLNTCIEQLREIGVPISQAIREYVAAHRILCGKASVEEAARTYSDARSKADLKPIKFNEVSAEFLLRCERNGLSETYKAASRKFLKRVSRRLGSSHIQDITSKEIGNVAPIASQNYRMSKRCPPKWVTHQGNSANTMQSWPLLRRPRSGFLSCA
jgi:hypothetical protein